jgi:hypothetical protein
MSSRAENCRQKAQECEALAAAATDAASRTYMQITAKQWRELAEQVDRLDLSGPLMRSEL